MLTEVGLKVKPELKVEQLVRGLNKEDRETLGLFKAIELSNALSKGNPYYELNHPEFCLRLQQLVRQTMRTRSIYIDGRDYSLKGEDIQKIMGISSKAFFLGRKDTKGEHWSNALSISHILLTNLKNDITKGLLLFYVNTDYYPKVLLTEVNQILYPTHRCLYGNGRIPQSQE